MLDRQLGPDRVGSPPRRYTAGMAVRLALVTAVIATVLCPSVRTVAAPQGSTLEAALRIPADALPSSCTLSTRPASPGSGNPAFGTDKRVVMLAPLGIAGPAETPDGPPLDRAQTGRFQAQLASRISEGFVAS